MTDTTDKQASGALRQAMNRSAAVAKLIRQRFCNHRFAIEDLKAISIGSGSTGKAAIREGFRFIGIEREAQYVEIARARIEAELAKRG